MKFNILLATVVAVFAITACSKQKTVTRTTPKSGIVINYVTEGEGEGWKMGDFAELEISYYSADGKELFTSADMVEPIGIPYDTAGWAQSGQFYEVLALLVKGDSVTFDVDASDLYTKTFGAPSVPDSIGADSKVSFQLLVKNIYDREGFMAMRDSVMTIATLAKVAEKYAEDAVTYKDQVNSEKSTIEAYAKDNGLDVMFTESGLGYAITEQGSGENAKAGDNIMAHYSGYLLDGTKFDSSVDRGQPFGFQLGLARVIRGWDEGFTLLNPGSKATLLIPSSFAYGERGAGGDIPSNAILRFDVELIEIQ